MQGETARMVVHLHCIDPAHNKNRFYVLSLEKTLFGEWSVVREWGRIGSRGGQRRENWFMDPESARAFIGELAGAKRKRGYRERD